MQYYTQIKDNKDIEELMDSFGWFHDSCIKELEYYSGSYVDSNRCMYPFNSSRCVRMVFQSQNGRHKAFDGSYIRKGWNESIRHCLEKGLVWRKNKSIMGN